MKTRLAVFLFALLLTSPAFAQSTATPVAPGYLGTNGCVGTNSPCYAQDSVPKNSASAESSHVFKAAAGTLFGLSVTSGNTAGYVLIFNATSAPSNGAVTPVACYVLAANQTIGIAFTPFPLRMSTGITAVFSSTGCFTQTTSATAFFLGEVM